VSKRYAIVVERAKSNYAAYVEPELNDHLHEDVTHLLCELTAYNIMHTLHELLAARPKTKFRG